MCVNLDLRSSGSYKSFSHVRYVRVACELFAEVAWGNTTGVAELEEDIQVRAYGHTPA
jgi:hypothetical protein